MHVLYNLYNTMCETSICKNYYDSVFVFQIGDINVKYIAISMLGFPLVLKINKKVCGILR